MKESISFLSSNIKQNDTVVCATSGGVDSMVLLSLLINLREKINFNIICAHINHNLREESFEEYDFVKEYCLKHNVIFEGTIFEKHISGNFESESRKKRYEFFDTIVKKYNAKYLLTAHHGDDLIETILMKIARGSTIEGYSGFDLISAREGYLILRPLIYVTKENIRLYAKENHVLYKEDKTNYDLKYTRNRYRANILPLLKEENKNIHLKYLKFNNEINEASRFINKYIDDLYIKNFYDGKLYLNLILELDEYILKRLIRKVLYNFYKDDINRLNDKHIDEILSIINSSKPNLSINLPLDYIACKHYDVFEIRKSKFTEEYKYEINDKDIDLEFGVLKRVEKTNLKNNFVCHLNSKDIKLPIYVRNKRDGDRINILGLNGSKKLKDVFINEKVPKSKRGNYPVVVDSNDIVLWIPGLKKSKYDVLKNKNYDIILWYIDKEEKNE